MAEGIDVYTKYQQVADFGALRAAGVEFCYVKASDGGTLRDTAGYGPRGRQAGVKMGGYHYAQPGSPEGQADLFVTACESGGLTDLAPALDIESNANIHTWGTQEAIDFSVAFLRRVQSHGYRACLYANNSMLSTIRGPVLSAVPGVYVWCARYGGTPTVAYDVHQYTDAGTLPGVVGTVDRNRGTVPLNQNLSNPVQTGGFTDMSDAYPAPKVLTDGTYRYHVPLANWNKVNGRYIALSTGFSGCSFRVWMQLADGSYVDSPDGVPSGSYGKVLTGTLAADNVHWLGIPADAQSVSADITPSTSDGVPALTIFTDGK